MEDAVPQMCPTLYAERLERPITYDEILTALRAGARDKAPKIDGLALECYTANWDTIREDLRDLLNQTFLHTRHPTRNKGLWCASLNPMTPTRRTATARSPFSPLNTNSSPELRYGAFDGSWRITSDAVNHVRFKGTPSWMLLQRFAMPSRDPRQRERPFGLPEGFRPKIAPLHV